MGRGPKPAKSKVRAKRPASPKSLNDDSGQVQDLEKRLAEAQAQLQTRDRELIEAQDQQTAAAEILRVISSSPTDVQPVFSSILESAMRLCHAHMGQLYLYDGEKFHNVANRGASSAYVRFVDKRGAFRPVAGAIFERMVAERRPVQLADLRDSSQYRDRLPGVVALVELGGARTYVAVPMLKDDRVVGGIFIFRPEVRPFTQKQIDLVATFASQAVIAIANVRLFTETKEALERQTATSEILRVISRSPTDAQPVFDTIAQSAVRLCDAVFGAVFRLEGEQIHLVAQTGISPQGATLIQAMFPISISLAAASTVARAIMEHGAVHVLDTEAPQAPRMARQVGRAVGFRSQLTVPMLRGSEPIGAVSVSRREPGRFSDAQIELLKTFADQAVIAIENVRLFTELQTSNRDLTTALDKQTATSDILRVISRSQTDVQPVFEAILSSAVRLIGAYTGALTRVVDNQIELIAFTRTDDAGAAALRAGFPQSLQSELPHAQAIRSRAPLNIADAQTDPRLPEAEHVRARVRGFRSRVLVPLLRHGESIGVISVARREPGGFNGDEISLLQTFADQAVIAIENVRLFTELQEKNQALTTAHAQVTESLQQQTATAEILRVISSSPTDLQPVFDAIAENSVRLCKADYGSVNRLDGDVIHLVAQHGQSAQWMEAARRLFPHPLTRDLIAGGAMLDREVVHLADMQSDTRFPTSGTLARTMDYRTALSVPILRDNEPVGAIVVFRQEGRPFSEAEIGLLRTFADQAVIAIENVRLFTELQARTQELTQSVGKLTALGEVGRAVSSTLDLETVLSTIVSRAIQLSGTDGGSVYEYDEVTEEFSLRASRDLPESYVEQVRDTRPRKGEGAVGRVAQSREPVQIVDISDATAYESRVRNILLRAGLRALLAVPLIAEDHLVGALIVMRKRTGSFAEEEVALLQTFATQSALAIQNARLFREIEDKSRQLEVASQHKSEFLANMSHELRTPLNAIIGFSEVLAEKMFGELNEKQEEYSKDIHASGQHLLSLINDILDLSKIEAGRMELELSNFHLPTALDSALTLVRERAGRRSITLQMNVDSRLSHIQADERKVRQVVLNLLSNAIKFTPEGGRIEVTAGARDGAVEVSVSDTGVGIAPEDQEAVFEEFRQVGTADKKVEGTGLGLTLCRKFVELHGGKIWVKSQVGVGSTFTFTIPVRPGQ